MSVRTVQLDGPMAALEPSAIVTKQGGPNVKKCPTKPDAIMLTHGEGYSTLAGKAVTARAALTFQQDLFVTPQEDGLFPGHSQTWKKEA